ncbi:hydrogenase maturation nickel metallochaperone HypA [Desulfovibrio sulfodismutans]|jgi:hydrogenase nickel incorporation protein HypA/HybF|uniref:Hydrogenase maturation factor HypA n=1 Tax=Desulfolutivibrio sulfodismutans TaxID=63561 RepID=A0A7K3NHG8_9BACT|nr:hydrogenase maturation nickel metallochaperone HypA [Desulfolutivibrio sulfodismutans]MDQ7832445.1 hydrogenase maturation nickel metallochaperone HypA [Desulfovibrionaceae bacterium]NDY55644.1 hydrogenase maturation nickel metallochaperone HypA [Desulfolutivibrio sulfodismutans]QLA11658.1 hydrogenase maturation nickel metallochaperone HypA [Desulfolutivibrio sulfodismutans DSM 3696]
MHELSIAQSLLAIIREEMQKHGSPRLISVKVRHGRLSAIVPDALAMSFEALTMDTALAGARLDTEEIPLVLACRACGTKFSPESSDYVFAPCPACGEELGHTVVSGKELYIEYLELDEAQGT